MTDMSAVKNKAYQKWATANRGKVRERNRRWAAANKEKKRAQIARWAVRNKDKVRGYKRRSARKQYLRPEVGIMVRLRTRLKSALHSPTPRSRDHDAAAFLLWCRPENPSGFHIDHLFPLSSPAGALLGNKPENVRWLPKQLNLLKRDRQPAEAEVAFHRQLVFTWRTSCKK